MKDTTAVIVTHNNARTMHRCLESLVSHGISNIIVVDSHSEDGTVDIARAYPVRVVRLSQNLGFAAAANIGAAHADTACILFLNPDAVLMNPLREAAEAIGTDRNIGVIGLGLYDTDGNLEENSFGQEPNLCTLFIRKVRQPGWLAWGVPRRAPGALREAIGRGKSGEAGPGNTIARVDWVSGGAMLTRADVFRKIGGFDEQFFLYWEDVDLCRRAREAGHRVVSMPSVRVQHERGHSAPDILRKTQLYDKSADRYFQKHYAAPIWLMQRCMRYIYRQVSPYSR